MGGTLDGQTTLLCIVLRVRCRKLSGRLSTLPLLEFMIFPNHCLLSITTLFSARSHLNPLIATLKPQSNGPSYSNTVIGTLAVDGWAVAFVTARRGLVGAAARPGCTRPPLWPPALLAVPNVTAHPSTPNVPTSYYSLWHYNCLWSLKG